MPIHACLFDIGNVLVTFDYVRTFPALAGRTARTYDEIHRHLAGMTTELETGRLPAEQFIAAALDFIGGGVTRDEFLTAFTEIFAPIPPVWEMLQSVRRRAPMHLFSNTSELHETYLLRRYPDFSWFSGGFFSWRLGVMKPDRAIYETALNALRLPAEQIVYVDDLPANIETGRAMGMQCHLFDRTSPEALRAFLEEAGLL